jgi:hypothetical protein
MEASATAKACFGQVDRRFRQKQGGAALSNGGRGADAGELSQARDDLNKSSKPSGFAALFLIRSLEEQSAWKF